MTTQNGCKKITWTSKYYWRALSTKEVGRKLVESN